MAFLKPVTRCTELFGKGEKSEDESIGIASAFLPQCRRQAILSLWGKERLQTNKFPLPVPTTCQAMHQEYLYKETDPIGF